MDDPRELFGNEMMPQFVKLGMTPAHEGGTIMKVFTSKPKLNAFGGMRVPEEYVVIAPESFRDTEYISNPDGFNAYLDAAFIKAPFEQAIKIYQDTVDRILGEVDEFFINGDTSEPMAIGLFKVGNIGVVCVVDNGDGTADSEDGWIWSTHANKERCLEEASDFFQEIESIFE